MSEEQVIAGPKARARQQEAAGGAGRRWRRPLPALLVTVFVLVAPLASASSTPASCAPSAAKILARSGASALYSEQGHLFGCLAQRVTPLGALNSPGHFLMSRVTKYALAAPYAGIVTVQMGVDTFSSEVSVFDLETGRRTGTASATTPENRAESFITVAALVLDSRGTLAWIGARSAVGAFTPIYEVHTLNTTTNRLLDSGPKLKPSSLTLKNGILRWTDGATKHHLRLKP